MFFLILAGLSLSGAAFADSMTNIIYEAENAEEMVGVTVASSEPDFLGTGYADFGEKGGFIKWKRVFSDEGDATLSFRYASASSSGRLRPTDLYVNGTKVSLVEWTPSATWKIWQTNEVQVKLQRGINTVELHPISHGGPNIDRMTVTSRPADLRTVPDLAGQLRDVAQSTIISAGLIVGKITTEYSDTVASGRVISQAPEARSSVPAGSPVDLVISLGEPTVVGQAGEGSSAHNFSG